MVRFTISVLCVLSTAGGQSTPEWGQLLQRAVSLRDSGSGDAEPAFQAAIAKAKTMDDGGLAESIASTGYSVLLLRQGRYAEAEDLLLRTIRVLEQHPQSPNIESASAYHNLASLKRETGQRDAEERYFRLALETIDRDQSGRPLFLIQILGALAVHYVEVGRLSDAAPLLERADAYETDAMVVDHPSRVPLLIASSELLLQRGEPQQAKTKAALAVRIVERVQGGEDMELVGPLHQLARAERELGRLRDAAAQWQRSLLILRARRSENYPQMTSVLIHLASIARQQGKDGECEMLLRDAVRVARESGRPAAVALAEHQLGLLHASRKRYRQAEPLFRSSLAGTLHEIGKQNRQAVFCMSDLAVSLIALRRHAEAETLLREAIATAEQMRGGADYWLPGLLERHAEVLRKLKRKDEAKAVAGRAKALLESGLVARPGQTVDVLELKSKR